MMATVNGVMTGILLVLFVGIWIWAWSGRNKQKFDEMSRLPLEGDSPSIKEKHHE